MATPSTDWSTIIADIIKDNGKAWEAEFLKINKTADERMRALDALKEEADIEWKRLLSTPIQNAYKIDVDSKALYNDYKHWQSSLDPLPEHGILTDGDRYYIDANGKIHWNTRYLNTDEYRHNRNQYVSDEYLPGKDFFTTRWSSTPTEVLIKQLKSGLLAGLFKKGKENSVNQTVSEWSGWLNGLAKAERQAWKAGLKTNAEDSKRRALAAITSIINPASAQNAYKDAVQGIRQDIADGLGRMREQFMTDIYGFGNDMIDRFQELGSKFINGYRAKAYDYSVQLGRAAVGYMAQRFGGVASKFAGVVPDAVARVLGPSGKILGDTLNKVAGRLGLNKWLGDVKGGSEVPDIALGGVYNLATKHASMVTNIVNNEDVVGKRLTPEIQQEWETQQLLETGEKFRYRLAVMLEDYGYVNTILRSINYTRSYHFINRPVLESETNAYYRSYVFFTRPNLNLIIDDVLNPALDQYPELKAIVLTDPGLYSELCRDGAYKSNLFKLLNNYVKDVTPPRLPESSREGVMNMHGKSMPTPGVPEIYGENEITVTFMDNNRGDIYKLMYMLSMYKEFTAKQGFPMRDEYIKFKGLDYLMSIYTVVVDLNWNVINFAVGYSLIPPEPPTHLSGFKLEGQTKNELMEDFSMTFKCTTFIPFAPDQYDTFNLLSGFNFSNMVDMKGADGISLLATGKDNKTIFSEGPSQRKPLLRASFKPRQGDDPGDEPVLPFKGLFEMMAISPGFYRMSQKVDKDNLIDTRLNIKLGFSS